MKTFLDDNFLLQNATAERLFHEFARDQPIIDYHCHLPADQIARDLRFGNLTQAWLAGDHYKWRAMRTNGVEESFITGDRTDEEKFAQWAATVPYTLRNPLYHWTHLELKRYFGVDTILNSTSGPSIYEHCSELLRTPEFSVRGLLKKMRVEMVCTTDDPVDDLRFHRQLKNEWPEVIVRPAFRPDAAMQVDNVAAFNRYLARLAESANVSIDNYDLFLSALKSRHDYFAHNGCNLSDHGLESIPADDYTHAQVSKVFAKVQAGKKPDLAESRIFRSAVLMQLAEWDHEKGWVQQFHLGALRNNNTRMMRTRGADSGWDSVGDFPQAAALSKFLNGLDVNNRLAKTILYNLNPADNEVMATMIGNFNDGSIAGKLQWGAAWWFLDQKDGITSHLNALSNMGMISRFVGMLTDSRSFLSFPRHEYFRRILCNLFGREIESGELPNDIPWTGKIIADICYHNAKQYFAVS